MHTHARTYTYKWVKQLFSNSWKKRGRKKLRERDGIIEKERAEVRVDRQIEGKRSR